jgi:hypothetical protein
MRWPVNKVTQYVCWALFIVWICAGCSKGPLPGEAHQQSEEKSVQPQEMLEQQLLQQSITPLSSPSPTANDKPMQTPPAPDIASVPAPSAAALHKKHPKVKVKGIYASAWNMKGKGYDSLLTLLSKTDLNAMVIDVKDDLGRVTYPSQVKQVLETGANQAPIIPDLKEKLVQLKEKGIYTIGRVVVFKDPLLASVTPEYALQKKTGGVWRDPKGVAWVDPYHEEVWAYNIAVAKEAAELGFDEIQYDYVRFPDNGKKVDTEVQYYKGGGISKEDAIQSFLRRSKEQLGEVIVSADVFGLTTSSKDDMNIGQSWDKVASVVDVISPMTYPSHYSKGMYGLANPDMKPYAVISHAMKDALEKNRSLHASGTAGEAASIRPWYQDFTAKWVKPHLNYGNKEVREQIRAGQEQGIEEYLLWNPSGKYTYR